jgi:hypothetical protein
MVAKTTDIPIACNPQVFSKVELDEAISLALDVIFRLPKSKRELPDGFLFEYQGNEELFLEVARFVYNEHRCCPWESFAIEMEPFAAGSEGIIRLRYLGGSEEGKALQAEAMKQLEAAAFDPKRRERLKATLSATNEITPDNKASFYAKVSGKAPGLLDKLKSACGC